MATLSSNFHLCTYVSVGLTHCGSTTFFFRSDCLSEVLTFFINLVDYIRLTVL